MKKYLYAIKKFFSQKITLLFILHSPSGPVKKHFSLSFLIFIIFIWTLFTAVSVYFSTRHIDYWSVKIKTAVLGTKYEYLNKELSKIWEMLAQVENNDKLVRKLLNMKSKKDIIINTPEELNKGGPTTIKQSLFLKEISKSPQDVSVVCYKEHFDLIKQKIEQYIQSCDEIFSYIKLQKEMYRYTPLIWPCRGNVVSSFGRRIHPVFGFEHFHTGIDIANNRGTPIHVTADGQVKFAGWQEGYGKVVVVEHKFGYITIYGHLSSIKVKQGQYVSRGEIIGLMGDTGTTTGPHLHYEVWQNNKLCNPVKFLSDERFF